MATLKEVADYAGVSTSTVSRVLGRTASAVDVSVQTQQKILEAARRLGYVPNQAARQLRLGYGFSDVGLVCTGGLAKFANEPFFWSLMEGASSVVLKTRHRPVFVDVGVSEYLGGRRLHQVLRETLSALIVVGYVEDDVLAELELSGLPCVSVFPHREMGTIPVIETDDEQGMRLILEHLRLLGHKYVRFVSGTQGSFEHPAFAKREGWACAHAGEFGIDVLPTYRVRDWADTTRDGLIHRQEMQNAVQSLAPATAAVAANDYIALWLCRSLEHSGIRVPNDMTVVGFDDLEWSRYASPPLTTVRVPTRKVGEEAAQLCLAHLGGKTSIPKLVRLAVELVVRLSSGPSRERAVLSPCGSADAAGSTGSDGPPWQGSERGGT